jgi:hypothetical protein
VTEISFCLDLFIVYKYYILLGPSSTGTLIYSFFAFPYYTIIIPPLHRRGIYCFTSVRPSICPSVQDIFRHIFLSNYWWQKSDIWSQASYRYAILWEAFLDPSDSYFLFADLIGFYTHWTYMRGYHKWALAHSSSCCIIISEFIYNILSKLLIQFF